MLESRQRIHLFLIPEVWAAISSTFLPPVYLSLLVVYTYLS